MNRQAALDRLNRIDARLHPWVCRFARVMALCGAVGHSAPAIGQLASGQVLTAIQTLSQATFLAALSAVIPRKDRELSTEAVIEWRD